MKNKIQSVMAAAAVVILGVLGGCSFAPKYTVPPVQTPVTYKELDGWKVAQPKDDVIRGKWWEMFNDPLLNTLEEQVAISNQTLLAALANLQEARAVTKEARSQYFPAASLEPSVTKTFQSSNAKSVATSPGSSAGKNGGNNTFYSLPLDASWEPDLWGAIRNTVKADVYTAQASAANLEDLRLTAQADVAVDYLSLRGQDALKAVLDATVIAYQKTLDLTKTLFQHGIDSDEDVSQAETQLATTQAQATNIGIQRAQYEHAIALLLGKPASMFSIPVQPSATNLNVQAPEVPVGIPSELLERRPDVAAAERSVAAANAQIGVARAAFFPTLTLTGSAGFESASIGKLLSGPSAFAALGAMLVQPVFDAGLRKATVEQFTAAHNAAAANYRQAVLTAFQEVEDNLAALRILSQERQQQDTAVRSAERTLALATHRYELGIDSYLNVIVAQTVLLNNQQTAVNLHTQQMTSSVQLILTLGGGWNYSQISTAGRPTIGKSQ
jgi:NodT family efflux transporter outer membrane factor (OMF) lipoprotein